jgi:branched-chain amino acid transport system permease protein
MLVNAVNFAHAGFMGVGAYISAALVIKLGLSFWITFILGGIASAIFAIFFGFITLRLKGAYFFLVSFALCEIIRISFSSYQIKIFGGVNGLIGIPTPNPIFGLQFKVGGLPLFYLTSLITIIFTFITYLIEKCYWGKVFRCITESQSLAESVGINVTKYKLTAFVIGCFIAGIAGSLYASFNGVITPLDFTFRLSLFVLVCVVFGGREGFFGPALGVAALVAIGEAFRSFAYFEPIIWGACIIIVLLFAPQGLLGFMDRILVPVIWKFGKSIKRENNI